MSDFTPCQEVLAEVAFRGTSALPLSSEGTVANTRWQSDVVTIDKLDALQPHVP